MNVDLLKTFSYQFPEEKPNNSSSLVQYPATHFQSHDINATLPSIIGTVPRPNRTEQSTTPLTEYIIYQEILLSL